VKRLFALLLSGSLLALCTGCPNTPTSPRTNEKKDDAKKEAKAKDDR
jgi:hypothetical protein